MTEVLLRVWLLSFTTLVSILLLRQWRGEFVPLLRVGAIILCGLLLLSSASPILDFLHELTKSTGIEDKAAPLFRALGIALLTQLGADLSRECGESGIASLIELAGKIEILWISLPLIREILGTARELLAVGG